MRRTLQYVAMTKDERNEADAVPAQAGISVFQQPANKKPPPREVEVLPAKRKN